jgi:hypothetical protein
MCRYYGREANSMVSVYSTLCRWTATSNFINAVKRQKNLGLGSTCPLARGQYIYGRASQTEQRSARWASWYSRATWASNFRFFHVIQYRLITDMKFSDKTLKFNFNHSPKAILNEVMITVIVYPPFFLQVRCSRNDLLLLFGLFGFISYLY